VRNLLHITTLIIVTTCFSLATDHDTITGKVTDNLGKPLDDATVMIWHAGVKKGYSIYCPSCYRDCGKRTITDRTGSFTIKNLDPDLWFELLVVRDGYTPAFVKRVDPSDGTPKVASLAPRMAVGDPTRVVRGRVVDPHGRKIRNVVVVPIGIAPATKDGVGSMYGTIKGLDPVAVTDSRGQFELAYHKEASGMMLQVEARGMATKLIAVPTGAKRKTITVFDGAAIRGRLLNHGKPWAGAEIGLIAQDRGGFGNNLKIIGNPYHEIRIGTQDDGSFLIPNVPTPVAWYVYAKMESIAALGATDPVKGATTRNGELVNVGDIQVIPGHRLRGKVTLSDGARIADGMRVTISADRVWDSQTVVIGHDGNFEFNGLPAGRYEIFPSVQGYRLQDNRDTLEITVDRDIDAFAIALEPPL
jgi:hypothetical protein